MPDVYIIYMLLLVEVIFSTVILQHRMYNIQVELTETNLNVVYK